VAFLIVHPEYGIYLGRCLGLGFWSKLDPVGQPSACTFESQGQAEAHMARWVEGPPEGVRFHPVEPDDGPYATVAAWVAAGLEPWEFEKTPVRERERAS
jgi:hypothetical protein